MALFFLIWNKPNDVIRGTVKHHTEPFEGGKRDVPIFLQGVQSFIIKTILEKLVLRNLLAAHCFPKRGKVNQICHHFCLEDGELL